MTVSPPKIIFQDEALIILEKPAGMSSLAKRCQVRSTEPGTFCSVEEWLQKKYPEAKLVHRLDNDTSGLMIAAKTQAIFEKLREVWNTPSVTKKYIALVLGRTPASGTITTPIAHHPRKKKKMMVRGPKARPAETRFRTLRHLKGLSLVEIKITTGVRHQIRVHMASAGHPLAGDKLYQKKKGRLEDPLGLTKFLLHLASIEFPHPVTGEKCNYESPFDNRYCDLDLL